MINWSMAANDRAALVANRGRAVAREGRQAGVADEEDVEVLREVLVAGRRAAIAHVGRVAGQEDVADLVLLEEVAQSRVTLRVEDHHVGGLHVDVLGYRDRHIPEPRPVILGPASRPGNWRK